MERLFAELLDRLNPGGMQGTQDPAAGVAAGGAGNRCQVRHPGDYRRRSQTALGSCLSSVERLGVRTVGTGSSLSLGRTGCRRTCPPASRTMRPLRSGYVAIVGRPMSASRRSSTIWWGENQHRVLARPRPRAIASPASAPMPNPSASSSMGTRFSDQVFQCPQSGHEPGRHPDTGRCRRSSSSSSRLGVSMPGPTDRPQTASGRQAGHPTVNKTDRVSGQAALLHLLRRVGPRNVTLPFVPIGCRQGAGRPTNSLGEVRKHLPTRDCSSTRTNSPTNPERFLAAEYVGRSFPSPGDELPYRNDRGDREIRDGGPLRRTSTPPSFVDNDFLSHRHRQGGKIPQTHRLRSQQVVGN